MREMPLKDARDQLGQLVQDVQRTHEPVVITRYGKSEAVILDFEEWQELDAMRDAADVAVARARLADGTPDIPLAEALRQLGVE